MGPPISCPAVRRVSLEGQAPSEVASQLRHLEGLVFFDTAGNRPSSSERPVSVIAARPAGLLKGNLLSERDRLTLRKVLRENYQPTKLSITSMAQTGMQLLLRKSQKHLYYGLFLRASVLVSKF